MAVAVLAMRLLWRDWKSGELALLGAALVVAVAIITGIALFADRLERALVSETSVFLGADRLISGTSDIPEAWLNAAHTHGLATASAVNFPSMLAAPKRNQLVSVKAVSESYPLRGQLVVSDTAFGEGRIATGIPRSGEVWLDSRLLPALGVQPGDEISLGYSRFRIARVLISEPDRGGDVFSLGPRLLMRLADVAATGLIQPGSRANYRVLLSGSDRQLAGYHAWLNPSLEGSAFSWVDITNSSPAISGALERTRSFLLLGGLLGVLLSGIAIALGAHRYSKRHYEHVAVLKTLGETPTGIIAIFLTGFLLLGCLAIGAGLLLGFAVQLGIGQVFADLIPTALPEPGFKPFLTGAATGFICLLTFALPPVLMLRNISPMRVLRLDFVEADRSSRMFYILGLSGVFALLLWYSQSLWLTGILLLGLVIALTLLLLLTRLMLLAGRLFGMQAGSAWRLALAGIQRRSNDSSVQVLTFSIVLMLLLILVLIRTDLLAEWQAQLPKDAANHFVINVTAKQRAELAGIIAANVEGEHDFFPSLRGRMTHIGGEPVQDREARHRDIFGDGLQAAKERNLTWATEFPKDNKLLAGAWWPADTMPARPLISIEKYIADLLQARVGEIVRFQVAERTIEAEIASIRKVRWDGFRPNFYIIFSPGVLEDFPGTWMTSFYLPAEHKLFLNELLSRFPTVTVIELDVLIKQVQFMIGRITLAIELMLLLVLAAGGFVLVASIHASLDQRRREQAVLFALGADRRRLLASLWIEFSVLGLCSGIIGSICAEIGVFFLWRELFLLDALWHPLLWWLGPVAGLVVIAILGLATTWRVFYTSPVVALRQT